MFLSWRHRQLKAHPGPEARVQQVYEHLKPLSYSSMLLPPTMAMGNEVPPKSSASEIPGRMSLHIQISDPQSSFGMWWTGRFSPWMQQL